MPCICLAPSLCTLLVLALVSNPGQAIRHHSVAPEGSKKILPMPPVGDEKCTIRWLPRPRASYPEPFDRATEDAASVTLSFPVRSCRMHCNLFNAKTKNVLGHLFQPVPATNKKCSCIHNGRELLKVMMPCAANVAEAKLKCAEDYMFLISSEVQQCGKGKCWKRNYAQLGDDVPVYSKTCDEDWEQNVPTSSFARSESDTQYLKDALMKKLNGEKLDSYEKGVLDQLGSADVGEVAQALEEDIGSDDESAKDRLRSIVKRVGLVQKAVKNFTDMQTRSGATRSIETGKFATPEEDLPDMTEEEFLAGKDIISPIEDVLDSDMTDEEFLAGKDMISPIQDVLDEEGLAAALRNAEPLGDSPKKPDPLPRRKGAADERGPSFIVPQLG